MSELKPITIASLKEEHRIPAPEYPDRPKAPKNHDELIDRLNSIYKANVEQGNWWIDETNISRSPKDWADLSTKRRKDFIFEELRDEHGYDMEYDYISPGREGERLEYKNPGSHIGDLLFNCLSPTKQRLLIEYYKNPSEGNGAELIEEYSRLALNNLLSTNTMNDPSNYKIQSFLELKAKDDFAFIKRQLQYAIKKEYEQRKELHRQVNMGAIARIGSRINNGYEKFIDNKDKFIKTTRIGELATIGFGLKNKTKKTYQRRKHQLKSWAGKGKVAIKRSN